MQRLVCVLFHAWRARKGRKPVSFTLLSYRDDPESAVDDRSGPVVNYTSFFFNPDSFDQTELN